MAKASDIIKIAKNEVGYLEKKSNNNLDDKAANAGSNNYTKYARDYSAFYGGTYNYQTQAWCDMFVDWCFVNAFGADEAKSLLGGFSAYTPTSVQNFKNKGRWHQSGPQVGDIIFFKNSSAKICHTGIVYKVDSSKVYTIEGNTSTTVGVVTNGGCVAEKSYTLSYSLIAGYGRPAYDGSVAAKNTTSTTATSSAQSKSSSTPTLKKGCKGSSVKDMQTKLIAKGFSCGSTGADGDFGGNTVTAVKNFQKANGLGADGICGPLTWSKLNSNSSVSASASTGHRVGSCTGNGVNVRKSPSTNAAILRQLNKGNLFDILGTEGAWTKVNVVGVVGYVASQYVAVK